MPERHTINEIVYSPTVWMSRTWRQMIPQNPFKLGKETDNIGVLKIVERQPYMFYSHIADFRFIVQL